MLANLSPYPALQWRPVSINHQLLNLCMHQVLLFKREVEGDNFKQEHSIRVDVHFLSACFGADVLENLGGHEPGRTLEPHHAPRGQDLTDAEIGNLEGNSGVCGEGISVSLSHTTQLHTLTVSLVSGCGRVLPLSGCQAVDDTGELENQNVRTLEVIVHDLLRMEIGQARGHLKWETVQFIMLYSAAPHKESHIQ